MKRCVKDCCILTIVSLFLSFILFILFNLEILAITPTSIVFILSSIFISAYLFAKLFINQNYESNRKDESYCCCGHLAAIGISGTIISAFLLGFLNTPIAIISNILVSTFFFFLMLMVGGITCYLYAKNCHFKCDDNPCDQNTFTRTNNHNEQKNIDYTYNERRR